MFSCNYYERDLIIIKPLSDSLSSILGENRGLEILGIVKDFPLEEVGRSITSPEVIRAWSNGNPITLPDGPFCQSGFGTLVDWKRSCAALKETDLEGNYCRQSGGEISNPILGAESIGHIELVAPMVHPWFATGRPNKFALVLGIPTEQLKRFNGWASFNVDDGNPRVLEVSVALSDVVQVETLINTGYGITGPLSYAYLEFYGDDGAYYRKDLVGNADIRDWHTAPWTYTINGTTTTQVYGNSVGWIDKQRVELPLDFRAQKLGRLRLVDNGIDGLGGQRTFIDGISVLAPGGTEGATIQAGNEHGFHRLPELDACRQSGRQPKRHRAGD